MTVNCDGLEYKVIISAHSGALKWMARVDGPGIDRYGDYAFGASVWGTKCAAKRKAESAAEAYRRREFQLEYTLKL